MIFPFIENMDYDTLRAFSVILFMAFALLCLALTLRVFNQKKETKKSVTTALGKYGFEESTGEKVEMEILQIVDLSPTVKMFRLKPEKYFDYRPGQFLTFHLGENGDIARNYSLNTSPSRPGIYEVSIKLLEGGLGSTWMHNKVSIGDRLQVSTPSGRFYLKQEGDCTVFLAGGIGITPMLSMAKYCIDTGDQRPLYFFYATRSDEELSFHEDLQILEKRAPNFHYFPYVSKPSVNWKGNKGRVDKAAFEKAGIDFKNAELYTCGPRPMMDSAKEISVAAGMPESRFHYEIFASPTSVKRDRKQCKIDIDGELFDYDSDKPLLDFLESKNISIGSSCRAGVCGTCEIKVTQGDVFSLDSEYLTKDDVAEGRRLSCICFPEGDLKIEVS